MAYFTHEDDVQQEPQELSQEQSDETKLNVVHNQPYDETVEVSDGEEITSANATPRDLEQETTGGFNQVQQQLDQMTLKPPPRRSVVDGGDGQGMGFESGEDTSREEPSESESEREDGPHIPLSGAYDPTEYEHLQVGGDLKDLFQHIQRYTPQTIELDTKLKPFIPEYIPAIGDIDAFLKVSRPDGKSELLGLNVLDEPRAKQSDPTVLDLQLRTLSKQTTSKPVSVHSIAHPEKQVKEVDNWIESLNELHRQKPATNVHYTKNMPDIESLMQEWPPGFEDALRDIEFPTADMDCDLAQYTDIVCALLDIPVYQSRIHSLHVLFSLYMEFKNSQHFKIRNEGPVRNT